MFDRICVVVIARLTPYIRAIKDRVLRLYFVMKKRRVFNAVFIVMQVIQPVSTCIPAFLLLESQTHSCQFCLGYRKPIE